VVAREVKAALSIAQRAVVRLRPYMGRSVSSSPAPL
jgi:hypothetical protein